MLHHQIVTTLLKAQETNFHEFTTNGVIKNTNGAGAVYISNLVRLAHQSSQHFGWSLH